MISAFDEGVNESTSSDLSQSKGYDLQGLV